MTKALDTIFVNTYIDGILDPENEMLGPVKDGGHIVANTAPGCWGPMITPAIKGGHEVTKPVFVEGAEIGDSIAIYIKSVDVTSRATASGHDAPVEGRFSGDPFVAAQCPKCGTLNPETVIQGTGPDAVRCAECNASVAPFEITNGYTMGFHKNGTIGVTLPGVAAEKIAMEGREFMATPEASIQNPAVTLAPSDIPGVMARLRPFLGQLGTAPSIAMPDSHNAGDFGSSLVGALHGFVLTQEELDEHRTDGHMDINRVRAGSVLICPVKVKGGGVYLGDMHAMQGDGEIAGHTTDVSGLVNLQVRVLKNVTLEGPILLPNVEDLPYTAKPFTQAERDSAYQIAQEWGMNAIEEALPVSFIGTGSNLNEATDNGLARAAALFNVSVPEIMNRATITGSIEIGRHPGVVTVTFLAPVDYLKKVSLSELIAEQYRVF